MRDVSLDIWSRDDIRNMLLSVSLASNDAGGTEEYRRGHAAACAAIALAFGCKQDGRQRLASGRKLVEIGESREG